MDTLPCQRASAPRYIEDRPFAARCRFGTGIMPRLLHGSAVGRNPWHLLGTVADELFDRGARDKASSSDLDRL
jgi:hypothetical protein